MRRLAVTLAALVVLVVACSSSDQGKSDYLCYGADGDKAPPCVAASDPHLVGKESWLGNQVICVLSVTDGPVFNQNPGPPPSPTCCYNVKDSTGRCD